MVAKLRQGGEFKPDRAWDNLQNSNRVKGAIGQCAESSEVSSTRLANKFVRQNILSHKSRNIRRYGIRAAPHDNKERIENGLQKLGCVIPHAQMKNGRRHTLVSYAAFKQLNIYCS